MKNNLTPQDNKSGNNESSQKDLDNIFEDEIVFDSFNDPSEDDIKDTTINKIEHETLAEPLYVDEEITNTSAETSPTSGIRSPRLPFFCAAETDSSDDQLEYKKQDDQSKQEIKSPDAILLDPAAVSSTEDTDLIDDAVEDADLPISDGQELKAEDMTPTAPIRSARPPRAQIVRPSRQINPLEAGEIQAKDKVLITPLPRVDEILPKRIIPAPAKSKTMKSATSNIEQADTTKAAAPIRKAKAVKSSRIRNKISFKGFINQRQAGLLLLISAILEILLLMGWMSLPEGIFGLDKQGFSGHVLATALTQLLLVLFPSLIIVAAFRIPSQEISGEGKMSFSLGLLSFVIGIPSGLCLYALNNILMYALTRLDVLVPERTLPGLVMPDTLTALPLLLIVTVLAPAVFEELMFRGIMLPQMAKSPYIRSSLVLSAIAFALFHDDPLFWLAPLGAGLILAFLRLRSDNIFSSILTHASMNLSIIFISPLLPQFSSRLILSMGRNSSSFFYANLIIAIVMALLMMPLFIRFSSMTTAPVDLFGEDGQLITPPARQRVFFISKKQAPTDFSKLSATGNQNNPYLDIFFWLACLILLTYLLSAYFIRF